MFGAVLGAGCLIGSLSNSMMMMMMWDMNCDFCYIIIRKN